MQHIICDGASSDGTPEWLAQQKGVRWSSVPDKGMYEAIDRGFRDSDGDILSWLNADEQYLPGTLKRVGDLFKSRPEIEFVYGDVLMVNDEGEPLASRRDVPLCSFYVRNSFLYAYSCTMFFRRSLQECGLLKFNTRYRAVADMDLILRLLGANVLHHKISTDLSLYGLHEGNLSEQPVSYAELREVQREHGAFSSSTLRYAIKNIRRVHRLLRGGYGQRTVSYKFALDEVPNYKLIENRRVGGVYPLRKARI